MSETRRDFRSLQLCLLCAMIRYLEIKKDDYVRRRSGRRLRRDFSPCLVQLMKLVFAKRGPQELAQKGTKAPSATFHFRLNTGRVNSGPMMEKLSSRPMLPRMPR